MSDSHQQMSERELSDLIAALIDGSISDDQFRRLDDLLRDSPEVRSLYLDALQIHEELPEIAFSADEVELLADLKKLPDTTASRQALSFWQAGLAIAILLPIAFLVGALLPRTASQVSRNVEAQGPVAGQLSDGSEAIDVRFSSLARARFFGEMPPQIASSPKLKRDYVLMGGMVELAFPAGASAIIEGPAVFRVESDKRLALDIGRCSVHAPEGAEGFQVETPEVNVVDRGTRFSVHVLEDNATEVQVVEGAADIYGKGVAPEEAAENKSTGLRLLPAEARRFTYTDYENAVVVPYKAEQYKSELPDRVVSYDATLSDDGRVDELIGVQVQRGGVSYRYPVEHLIGSQVTHFHARDSHGYLIGDRQLPEKHAHFASDRSIRTGVINLGGSRQPLSKSPELMVDVDQGQYGTPGMAIRFDRPVTNGPGADVVLFELQMFSNPLEGDAFHVSPLEFRDGLRSHTVKSFDLTLESPEALQVQSLYLRKFDKVPRSLAELEAFSSTSVVQAVKFHAIAVGIDLSDLGYEVGATVEGLFFQDALNDGDIVDPTFIAGFPEIEK